MNVFSVRANGASPTDVGLTLDPMLLPITVAEVSADDPAATAGVRPGDRLVTFDGVSLQGLPPMGADFLLANHRPSTVATLGLVRAGAARTIELAVPVR